MANRLGGLALAVDVGGTKLEVGLVDRYANIHARKRIPTPRTRDGDELFDTLVSLGKSCIDEATREQSSEFDLELCGVGVGGPMLPFGETVSPLHIPAWRGFPFRSRMQEAFDLPTYVDNDAKALALAEGWIGAAKGVKNYMAMIVATGIGSGIVLNGEVVYGAGHNAGEIGHTVVVPDGRECECGAFGCLTAEASGPSIAAITGRPPEEATFEVKQRAGTLVGRAAASAANLLDLGLILAGGSVALGFGEPFFSAAQAEIKRSCRLDYSENTEIRPVALGKECPLVGAAAVGWRYVIDGFMS